jgi:RNA polymerase sigma factor (sigma-70 family)
MSNGPDTLLRVLRETVFPFGDEGASDRELLRRFVDKGDDGAFTALMRRHEAMVIGVGRRVLRHDHDAEDVCQATFLLLARKARSMAWRESIVNWLYGVAYRVALQTRETAAKRSARENRAPANAESDASASAAVRELEAILDHELARLPKKFADPLILCCFEGRTRDEAARCLGLPLATVKSRLEEGRERLRRRLTRRGVELTTLLASTTLLSQSTASPPANFARSTAPAALKILAGESIAGIVSARVTAMMHMGGRIMFVTKLKTAAALLLALGVVTAGSITLSQQASLQTPAKSPPQSPNAPQADQANVGGAPAASVWKERAVVKIENWYPGSVAYSPDGKTLVAGGIGGKVIAFDTTELGKKWDSDVGGSYAAVAFSVDGKSVLATISNGVHFLDATSGKLGTTFQEKLPRAGAANLSYPIAVGAFPDRDIEAEGQKTTLHKFIYGDSRRYFVVTRYDQGAPGVIELTNVADGKEPADANAVPLALDPAGRCVILTGPRSAETGKNVLWAWVAGDYDKGSPGNRILEGHQAPVVSAAWSKDGSTAVTGDAVGRVIVWDAAAMKETGRVEFGERIAALAITHDGKQTAACVIGKQQADFHVWETKSPPGKKTPIAVATEDYGNDGSVRASLAFSPNGRELAGTAINTQWLARTGWITGKVRVWVR